MMFAGKVRRRFRPDRHRCSGRGEVAKQPCQRTPEGTVRGPVHRDRIIKALRPVYSTPGKPAAKDRFEDFKAGWGQRYPAIVRFRESSGAEFVPFLGYDRERPPPGDVHAEYDRADQCPSTGPPVRTPGHFLHEAAALKRL